MNKDNGNVVTVNEYSRKKKMKLNKKALKYTAIGLGSALALSGIVTGTVLLKESIEDNYYSSSYSSDYSYDNSTLGANLNNANSSSDYNYIDDKIAFEIELGEDAFVEKKYPSVNVSISNDSYNIFNNYLRGLDATYSYEHLYGIDEAIKKYQKNSPIVNHSHDITNGTGVLSASVLYNRVIENNKEMLNNTSNLEVAFFEKLPDDEVRKACEILVECLEKEIKNNPDINAEEVYCTLYNMKIVNHILTTSNAFYNENDVLVVNPENIEKYQKFNPDIDAYRQVMHHESNHIIQTACEDNEIGNEVELGICHKYDDLEVNPFYWSWYLEAAAEKQMAKTLGEDTNTYSAPIGYYDSIILTSILNDGISQSDVENICYEKRSEDLFKALNANTKEEKIEVIKMMYSTEIMQSNPADFRKIYEKECGIDLLSDSEGLENLRLDLRIDILKTLSKSFYRSLSSQLTNQSLTLDTIYYLINVYESDVFIHLFYNEKARIASGVEFFDYYTEIQNEFFKTIEPYVDYNFDEIVDMFNNYSMNVTYNGNSMKNYSLDQLGEEDAKFIETKRMQNYQTGIPTIRSMPEYCAQNGYYK